MNNYVLAGGALITAALIGGAFVVLPANTEWYEYAEEVATNLTEQQKEEKRPVTEHVETPEAVKGIYMTQCVVGTPSLREGLVDLIEETELNSVVIDIKDYTGTLAFVTDHPLLEAASLQTCGAGDMREFIKSLHAKDIYVIGRITVFQDPFYTQMYPAQAVQSASRPGQPWEDYNGLSFVDVSSKPFWDYIVAISEESYALGFDELNYDYIRYPSDGPMKDAVYVDENKGQAVERFWKYLHEQVDPMGVVMSADLFGMVTTNTDHLGIGQQLERALPYFDYIMPMVYPSHYPKGFIGLSDPNSDTYAVIKYAMTGGVDRVTATSSVVKTLDSAPVASTSPQQYTKEVYDADVLRPWLQDFDYGKDYTPADMNAQIQATYDTGLDSWIFWDPANRYEALRQVL